MLQRIWFAIVPNLKEVSETLILLLLLLFVCDTVQQISSMTLMNKFKWKYYFDKYDKFNQ